MELLWACACSYANTHKRGEGERSLLSGLFYGFHVVGHHIFPAVQKKENYLPEQIFTDNISHLCFDGVYNSDIQKCLMSPWNTIFTVLNTWSFSSHELSASCSEWRAKQRLEGFSSHKTSCCIEIGINTMFVKPECILKITSYYLFTQWLSSFDFHDQSQTTQKHSIMRKEKALLRCCVLVIAAPGGIVNRASLRVSFTLTLN